MLLEINHLEKVFRTRFSKEVTRALQDVDFKVDENEFIAIMGESGSGKTTFWTPYQSRIIFSCH